MSGQPSSGLVLICHICTDSMSHSSKAQGPCVGSTWLKHRVGSDRQCRQYVRMSRNNVEMTKATHCKQTGIYLELAMARKSDTITGLCQRLIDRWEWESFVLKSESGDDLVGRFWHGEAEVKLTRGGASYVMGLGAYSTFFDWSWFGNRAGTKSKHLAVTDLVKFWPWWANSCRSCSLASQADYYKAWGSEFYCHL